MSCCICQKPKATLVCGICQESVCKYCAQFLEEGSFTYLPTAPQDGSHTTYCGPCYDSKVQPLLEAYQSEVAAAKNILVFTKHQNKETRFIKREQDPVQVINCLDREDVMMRLAFAAVKLGLNGVVDIDIKSKKIRDGQYQTTQWEGIGIPAHINPAKLIRDRSFSSDPN